MLHARFCVTRPIHVVHERHVLNAQTVDNDVRVNVATVVMTIRVRDDHRLMSGKMLLAKFHAEGLRLIYRQPMILCIPGIKDENVVMTFHIATLVVLLVLQICFHASDGKVILSAEQRVHPIFFPRNQMPVFVPDFFARELVMLKSQIPFSRSIVRVFRAYVFQCCQWPSPPSSKSHTSIRSVRPELSSNLLADTDHCIRSNACYEQPV